MNDDEACDGTLCLRDGLRKEGAAVERDGRYAVTDEDSSDTLSLPL
jgi:hypothetical protein